MLIIKLDMKPIVILGAGLAGLRAATELSEKGLPFVLLDRDERPGGRVKSDVVDGFILVSVSGRVQKHLLIPSVKR